MAGTYTQKERDNRRRAVADLYFRQGVRAKDIAEQWGVSEVTIYNDIKWIEVDENRLRLMDEGFLDKPKSVVVVGGNQDARKQAIEDLIEGKKTYWQISRETGLSMETLARDVNTLVRDIGHWGGRSMEDWRDQQLMDIDKLLAQAYQDVEAVASEELTESQAAKVRNMGGLRAIKLLERRAQLLGLNQQKQEVEVEHNFVISKIGGAIPLNQLSEPVDYEEGEYSES